MSPPGEQPAQPPSGGSERRRVDRYVADSALSFETLTAMGPGGQNVNRRSTRVRMRVRLADISIPPAALARLEAAATSRIVGEAGDRELMIDASEHRSQSRNREACLDRLEDMLRSALVTPKKRKKTRPTRGSVERRIEDKKQRGQIKRRRKPPGSMD